MDKKLQAAVPAVNGLARPQHTDPSPAPVAPRRIRCVLIDHGGPILVIATRAPEAQPVVIGAVVPDNARAGAAALGEVWGDGGAR